MLDLNQVESEKSFSPIKPGESVKVKLTKVEITEGGDLDLHFQGVDADNAGVFKPRFWASDLDPSSDRYNADKAETKLKHIRQILEAYLDNETVNKVKGQNVAEFYNSVAAALTADKTDVVATMKLVYKYNSDSICDIPRYGAFISTDFRPRGLKLRASTDANGVPYERVLPLSEYNASPDGGAPSAGTFGVETQEEEELPFGN